MSQGHPVRVPTSRRLIWYWSRSGEPWPGRALVCCLVVVGVWGGGAWASEPGSERLNTLIAVEKTDVSHEAVVALGADPWGVVDGAWHLRVSPSMLAELDARGVTYRVIHEDIDAAYREYRARLPRREEGLPQRRDESFADYRDLEAAEDFMHRIAQAHSEIAALEIIGHSVENRPIYALRLSDDARTVDPEEPGILLIGCHHAREWISVEVPLYFAEYLTSNYRQDGDVTRLLNYTEIWIIPVLNPDGYAYSWTDDRWWRKNRRDNGDGTFGVDPNRNYGLNFGGVGTSSDTSNELYCGPSAFSEPETQVIRDLMTGSYGRDFVSAISYHNYSQVVIYPWGYTTEATDNWYEYEALGMEMTRLINNSHSNPDHDYRYGQASRILYATSGDFTDWAHAELDVLAFTIELRPLGYPYFELPPDEIIPTCEENLPAFLYLAEETGIPDLRDLDADEDGLLDADDYCPRSPSAVIDTMGCDSTERDVDGDGLANAEDACGDSLPGQIVGEDGCRVAALFAVSVSANVESVEIEVRPTDIDAAGAGLAGATAFTREYQEPTTITLTAPQVTRGSRFRYWVVDDKPQEEGARTVSVTAENDTVLQAVYVVPLRLDIAGVGRIPDTWADGRAYIGQYTAMVAYSDGSTAPADANAVLWTLEDETVGAVTRKGELLAYDVSADEGEVATTLQASVDLGTGPLSSKVFDVSIFDAETRSPRCRKVSVRGPKRVVSGTARSFAADVVFEGGLVGWTTCGETLWLIESTGDEGGGAPPSASLSEAGILTVDGLMEDADVMVVACHVNEDGTACTAEKVVTLAAADPEADSGVGASRTGTSLCGTMSATILLALCFGMRMLRFTRR
jgi:hypothetical protein